jgi:4-methyl-5(b-hydroxyethyl)-thiazole monophosphate biosynthesis
MQAFIFLAEDFEEIEAVATTDILLRGGLTVNMVSITGKLQVTGAHGISVTAGLLFENADFSAAAILILPGGTQGAFNLNAHQGLKNLLKQQAAAGGKIAAICAAPLVLGGLDLLQGKKATAYPGYEDTLKGAEWEEKAVVKDGNILTGRGPGFSFDFGLAIIEDLLGKAKADEVAAGLLLK